MTQSEVSQALIYAGLGEMTLPTAAVREFEAYGDGLVNVARVLPTGQMTLLDGDLKSLYSGFPSDDDEVFEKVTEYGHYAAC